jgi:hypothetical protein
MYWPRAVSASMSVSHASAKRFCLSGKLFDFSVPSGPM